MVLDVGVEEELLEEDPWTAPLLIDREHDHLQRVVIRRLVIRQVVLDGLDDKHRLLRIGHVEAAEEEIHVSHK